MQQINFDNVRRLMAEHADDSDPFAHLDSELPAAPIPAKPELRVINGAPNGPMSGEMGLAANILRFLNGGKATFTVRNAKSGNRLTFKVSKPWNKETQKIEHNSATRFVSVLNGPDNESSFAYVGMIKTTETGPLFTLTKASKVGRDSASYRVFEAMWKQLNHISDSRLPSGLEFFHSGKCARCGRTLTVPESIESGFGPECIGKMF